MCLKAEIESFVSSAESERETEREKEKIEEGMKKRVLNVPDGSKT